jgi:hypothetical protein
MRFSFKTFLACVLAVALATGFALYANAGSSFNKQINYEGKLTDSSGVAVTDGSYCMKFAIYDALTVGNELWAETWDNNSSKVTTVSGLFAILLGTHTAFTNIFDGAALYLEIRLDPVCTGGTYSNVDPEIFTPRKLLGSVPSAFQADQLGGKTWEVPGTIGSTTASSGVFTILSANTSLKILEGTGATYYTIFQGGDQSGDITYTLPTASATGLLKNTAGTLSWDTSTYLTSVTAHNLLSTTHGDTLADTVVRGDIMYGNATPKWARLAFPASPTGKVLQATATDVAWSASALGTMAFAATGDYALVGQTMYIGTTQVAINRASAALTLAGITLTTPEIGAATGTSLDLGATTLYGSRAITVDTGGVFNIDIGSAAGDDFTVDTTKLVVEGDTGNVGIGTATPGADLHIQGTDDAILFAVDTEGFLSTLSTNAGGFRTNAANTVNIDLPSGSTINYNTRDLTGSSRDLTFTTGAGTVTAMTLQGGSDQTNEGDVYFSNDVGIGTASPGALLDIGLAGTTLGTLRLEGNTSGYVQLQSAAAAGSITLTLPSAVAGANNYPLIGSTAGVLSWNDQAILTTSSPTFAAITLNGPITLNDASGYFTNFTGAGSDDWGIYWNTTTNSYEFHNNGTAKAEIDLDTGNIQTDGSIGIGIAPTDLLHVVSTTAPVDVRIDSTYDGSSTSNQGVLQVQSFPTLSGAFGTGRGWTGLRINSRYDGTTDLAGVANAYTRNINLTVYTPTEAVTIPESTGLNIGFGAGAGASTATAMYGVAIGATSSFAPSAVTTLYGLYIGNLTHGGTNYSIYTGTAKSYFGGNVGMGTTAPDKALEINSATGANLRLTYNDSNGSAANYSDLAVSSSGDLTITPSGGDLSVPANASFGAAAGGDSVLDFSKSATTKWIMGNDATDDSFALTAGASLGSNNALTITAAGVMTIAGIFVSTGTGSLGWSVVPGTATTCNATCTSACVVGMISTATSNVFVSCTTSSSVSCLCAGSS